MAGVDPLIRQDSLIGGKYRLGPVIGSGGVAAVYRATHLWTEREVAVKLLDPTLPHFERLREGFLREARATVQLDHPNVVDVLDMGEDNSETAYLVMELLEGPTLRDVLIERGLLSEEYTLAILLPLVDALEKAHQLGIVHRDFKPENIMLTVDDYGQMSPKLLDFGVAEILQDKRSRDLSNNGNVIMGTPEYMSPEQARDQSHMVGPHSDVWGVGVVWYECLTGHAPFVGDSAVDVLTAVCESPVDFERVPEAYVPLLRDALGRTPDVRIATLSDFKARIEAMGVVESAPPVSSTSVPPPSVPSKTNSTLTGLGPEVMSSAERTSIAADAELETVPVRSHRKALFGGLALALVVALSAWWTVRDPGQSPVPRLKPAIVEHEVIQELDESDAVPSEPLQELAAEPTEEVVAAPTEEVVEAPTEEVAEALAEEVTAEPTEEVAAEPAEEVTAEPAEEVAAEPLEDVPAEVAVESVEAVAVTPEPKAVEPAASPPRQESTPVRRRKRPTSARPRYEKPPELVTEW